MKRSTPTGPPWGLMRTFKVFAGLAPCGEIRTGEGSGTGSWRTFVRNLGDRTTPFRGRERDVLVRHVTPELFHTKAVLCAFEVGELDARARCGCSDDIVNGNVGMKVFDRRSEEERILFWGISGG